MDCYVCNIESNDSNHCEICRYELQPLIEWLSEETVSNRFKNSSMPFLHINENDVMLIKGFLAGGQMPFGILDGNRLYRSNEPCYTYLQIGEIL